MLINVLLLMLGCLVDMAPSILITDANSIARSDEVRRRSGLFGMITLMNLGIGLCHLPVGATLFVGCAVGRVRMEDVMQEIWPFYGVMFFVLMAVKYRLAFVVDGTCVLRFDNEAGKGDHRHIGSDQADYEFVSVAQLLDDFWAGIEAWRKR